MTTYYLMDKRSKEVKEFPDARSLVISCLGKDVNDIRIYKGFDYIPQPYPTDIGRLEEYIDNKSYLPSELFEL